MNKVPIQIMDITTLKAVVFELSQDIVPSRFENAQQIDSHTLQLESCRMPTKTLESITNCVLCMLANF